MTGLGGVASFVSGVGLRVGCTATFTIALACLGNLEGGLLAFMVLIARVAYSSSIARATLQAKMATLLLMSSTSGTGFVFCSLIVTPFPILVGSGGFAGCSCENPLDCGGLWWLLPCCDLK